MSTPDSDKHLAHTDVGPSVVSSARHPGRIDVRDMMKSTYERPALEADIELPTSTAEQSSLVEDYQVVDWESALNDGDMSDTNSNTLTLNTQVKVSHTIQCSMAMEEIATVVEISPVHF